MKKSLKDALAALAEKPWERHVRHEGTTMVLDFTRVTSTDSGIRSNAQYKTIIGWGAEHHRLVNLCYHGQRSGECGTCHRSAWNDANVFVGGRRPIDPSPAAPVDADWFGAWPGDSGSR